MIESLKKGAVRLTGLDDTVAGVSDLGVAIYDYDKILAALRNQGMTQDDAREWFDFNIAPLAGQGEGFVILYEFNGIWEAKED